MSLFACKNYFLVVQILGNFKEQRKPTSEISQPILTTTMYWQTSLIFGNVSTIPPPKLMYVFFD